MWEARSLYFVAVGVPAVIIYQPVGLVIGGLGILVVIVMVRSSFPFFGLGYLFVPRLLNSQGISK